MRRRGTEGWIVSLSVLLALGGLVLWAKNRAKAETPPAGSTFAEQDQVFLPPAGPYKVVPLQSSDVIAGRGDGRTYTDWQAALGAARYAASQCAGGIFGYGVTDSYGNVVRYMVCY